MRLIFAAIAGGVMMFIWGAVSHMMTPIGEMGLKTVPNEAAVVAALQGSLSEPGFYFVPGMDMSTGDISEAEQAEWAAKYEKGPNAVVIYHPTGTEPMSMGRFGIELGSNIAAAFVAALILTWSAASFSKRVAIATLIGLTAWLSINVSYWNWYRFPGSMITGELIDQLIGWFLSGLVIAFVLRNKTLV